MRSMFLAAACVSLIACTVEAPDTSTTEQHAETHNRLAANRLAANRLAANRLAANRLAANSLSSTRLSANADTAEILGSLSGRIVYSYIVSCALPEGTTIEKDNVIEQECEEPVLVDPVHNVYDYGYSSCTAGGNANDQWCTNGHCVFQGGVGLTPDWVDHKLNPKGQGWVTACLLARVNANNTSESISLRGRNEALSVSDSELLQYTAQEGAFYGDVFGDTLDWNACSGENNDIAHDQLRDCATENPLTPGKTYCGFNYAGPCRDFTPATAPYDGACEHYNADATYYGECHGDADAKGHWSKHSKKYREVITTYVAF